MTQNRQRLRVLVVDDSAVHRQILSGVLARDPEIEIAGHAENGLEALRAVEALRPDVITLDEKMPLMDGLEVARQIMRDCPTPIVMVTSAGGSRGRDLAHEAVEAGALAVQDKRALTAADGAAAAELVRVVKSMAAVRLVRRRREPDPQIALTPALSQRERELGPPEIVAIGASTGGPQAIRAIVSRLPGDFPLPIVVVQHTTAGYAHTFVDWLRAETPLPIEIAREGQPLQRGSIYVAPTERHLVVRGRHLALLDTPPSSLHRPSATVLFQSVAHAYGSRAIGVLLTGMGDDGAAGLLDMRAAGALTVAQDEASSVVFGMPAEAIRRGAAEHVLPPEQIAEFLHEQTVSLRGAA